MWTNREVTIMVAFIEVIKYSEADFGDVAFVYKHTKTH